MPGWTRPDELAARTDIHVPDDGPYETLAGLVMTELGRVPRIGDTVTTSGARLTVEAMEGRRVTRLRVCPAGEDDEAAEVGEPGAADESGKAEEDVRSMGHPRRRGPAGRDDGAGVAR